MKRGLLAALWALLAPLAAASEEIRPQEQARLERFERSAGEALLGAMAGGDASDVAALVQALAGQAQVAFDPGLSGDWRCRTIRLGGAEALVVYASFDCRMTLDLTGVEFEKLSGSERTAGRITLRDGRAVYLGVGHDAGTSAPRYAELPPETAADGTFVAQVAVFERVSNTRARLMFPAPLGGGDFDILELTRPDR